MTSITSYFNRLLFGTAATSAVAPALPNMSESEQFQQILRNRGVPFHVKQTGAGDCVMVHPEGDISFEYSCIFGEEALVTGIIEVMICRPANIDVEPILELISDQMWVYDQSGIVRSNDLQQAVDWMVQIAILSNVK